MRHNIENGYNSQYTHVPVLWREVLEYVKASPATEQGLLVDCTLGEGGHSEILLENCSGLRIIAFDRDEHVLEDAKKRLAVFSERIRFVRDNFSRIADNLEGHENGVDFFLYDFGISSFHLDRSGRGFSFSRDENLDMRLDSGIERDASYIVNRFDEKSLADIFFRYGEERWSRKIAAYICRSRQKEKITTTGELAEIVLRAIPRRFHVKNIHPATRVFQALRIAVNDELGSIEKTLDDAYRFLRPGGLIMAISFHSLEDRIVKDRFRRMARGCTCGLDPKYCMCTGKPMVRILTRKPVLPEQDEIEFNTRARSARMRVCEKVQVS